MATGGNHDFLNRPGTDPVGQRRYFEHGCGFRTPEPRWRWRAAARSAQCAAMVRQVRIYRSGYRYIRQRRCRIPSCSRYQQLGSDLNEEHEDCREKKSAVPGGVLQRLESSAIPVAEHRDYVGILWNHYPSERRPPDPARSEALLLG